MTPDTTHALRAVLFDLDDTLFDHVRATRVALEDLRGAHAALRRWSLDELDRRHRVVLEAWHQEVLAGRATIDAARIARFTALLTDGGATDVDTTAPVVASRYRATYETAWFTVPGASALVDALRARGLIVAIITNNVLVEQQLKLRRCGLHERIDLMVTSEEMGVQKPDARIFRAALDRLGVAAEDAVMVGDAWGTDIVGALRAGIRPVWLNRHGETRHDARVSELPSFEPTERALAAILERPRV